LYKDLRIIVIKNCSNNIEFISFYLIQLKFPRGQKIYAVKNITMKEEINI